MILLNEWVIRNIHADYVAAANRRLAIHAAATGDGAHAPSDLGEQAIAEVDEAYAKARHIALAAYAQLADDADRLDADTARAALDLHRDLAA